MCIGVGNDVSVTAGAGVGAKGGEVKTTTGFAVRSSDGEGYYDMNGIGDWSLAGDPETCAIFDTPEEAIEAASDGYDGDDLQVVPITRSIEVTVGEPVNRIGACLACGAPIAHLVAGSGCPECGEELRMETKP